MKKFTLIAIVCALLVGCADNQGNAGVINLTSATDESTVSEETSDELDDEESSVQEDESSVAETSEISDESTESEEETSEVEELAWEEEPLNATYYVCIMGVYSREQAILGSTTVKLYNLNDEVSVVAVTNTDYYKLEDGTFLHKDFLSSEKTEVKPVEQTSTTATTQSSTGTSSNTNQTSTTKSTTTSQSTGTSAEKLLNSATLNPLRTGDVDVDAGVDEILAKVTTEGMSTYQKTKAVYDYMINTYSYGKPSKTCVADPNYHSLNDYTLVSSAYTLYYYKTGVCDDYSALFVVLTRAIGLESYTPIL